MVTNEKTVQEKKIVEIGVEKYREKIARNKLMQMRDIFYIYKKAERRK